MGERGVRGTSAVGNQAVRPEGTAGPGGASAAARPAGRGGDGEADPAVRASTITGTGSAGGLYLGKGNLAAITGTYNLNGGALNLKTLQRDAASTTAFNFGGGTLQGTDNFTTAAPMTLTGTGGNATVDTQAFAVTLSGDLTGPAGLNKIGASGTLTLSGNNSYGGLTTISDGTLDLIGTGTQVAWNPVLSGAGAYLTRHGLPVGLRLQRRRRRPVVDRPRPDRLRSDL